MDLAALLGRNFLRKRRQLKLTQIAMTQRSRFSQQYFSALENGKCNVRLDTLAELAEIVDCAPFELLVPDDVSQRS